MKRSVMTALSVGVLVTALGLFVAWSAAAQPDGGWDRSGNASEGWTDAGAGTAVSIEQARERAAQYLDEVGLSELTVGEAMQFTNHFYVAVVDPRSGEGAFELLVSRDGRRVHPEPGPTMMWNTEYSPMVGVNDALQRGMDADFMGGGMMGQMMGGMTGGMMDPAPDGMMGGMMDRSPDGMMGNGRAAECARGMGMGGWAGTGERLDQPLATEAALTRVQGWLDQNRPGFTATDPIAFPGYVTYHLARDGATVGMVSIQTSTGAIWEHTWHGDIVAAPGADQVR
jgi:hypothetical protein